MSENLLYFISSNDLQKSEWLMTKTESIECNSKWKVVTFVSLSFIIQRFVKISATKLFQNVLFHLLSSNSPSLIPPSFYRRPVFRNSLISAAANFYRRYTNFIIIKCRPPFPSSIFSEKYIVYRCLVTISLVLSRIPPTLWLVNVKLR